MTRLPPGTYTVQVHDLSTSHDFHLTGPGGIDRRTEVGEIEHPIWTLTFRAGTYTFKCDVHAAMKGTFLVAAGAPPPTRCRVPRVIGKTLGTAPAGARARQSGQPGRQPRPGLTGPRKSRRHSPRHSRRRWPSRRGSEAIVHSFPAFEPD
jgi:hypothetical protein